MFIYLHRMSDLYVDRHELSAEELYCDSNGNTDISLGEANTRAQAKVVLRGEGLLVYLSKRYIEEFLKENWEE